VAKLGKDYFGISDLDLAQEMEIYLEEERSGEIDTVQVNADGRLLLFFYAPHNKIRRYYLD